MTDQQQAFVASKEADHPLITLIGDGWIEVRTEGREGGAYWRRTWRITPEGAVFAPDYDADGYPAHVGG
jgi:hypothetical protein